MAIQFENCPVVFKPQFPTQALVAGGILWIDALTEGEGTIVLI